MRWAAAEPPRIAVQAPMCVSRLPFSGQKEASGTWFDFVQ